MNDTDKKEDEVLKRMLKTPPKEHAPKTRHPPRKKDKTHDR
jgi:hypothetical protein